MCPGHLEHLIRTGLLGSGEYGRESGGGQELGTQSRSCGHSVGSGHSEEGGAADSGAPSPGALPKPGAGDTGQEQLSREGNALEKPVYPSKLSSYINSLEPSEEAVL